MGARGVSLEHVENMENTEKMENMEMFSGSPTEMFSGFVATVEKIITRAWST